LYIVDEKPPIDANYNNVGYYTRDNDDDIYSNYIMFTTMPTIIMSWMYDFDGMMVALLVIHKKQG
jgi:hypothetical protein